MYRAIFRAGRPRRSSTPAPQTPGTNAVGYFLMFLVFSLPAALFSYAGPVFLAVPFVFICFLCMCATIRNILIRAKVG